MNNYAVYTEFTEEFVPSYRFDPNAHECGDAFSAFGSAGGCVGFDGAAAHGVDFVAFVDDVV